MSETPATPRNPDIEIYLKRVPVPDIMTWLGTHFDITGQREAGESLNVSLTFSGTSLECMIVENAAKGGYASVWFKENHTPWPSDEDCAREAFARFGAEVRCSVGGWVSENENEHENKSEGEPQATSERGGWYRFTESGQSIVNWLT